MVEDAATPDLPITKRSRWFWLRVTTSLFFGLLAVALVVLWAVSYWQSQDCQFQFATIGKNRFGYNTLNVYHSGGRILFELWREGFAINGRIEPHLQFNVEERDIYEEQDSMSSNRQKGEWRFDQKSLQLQQRTSVLDSLRRLGLVAKSDDFAAGLVIPDWMLMVSLSTLAAGPWIHRFSLRTMLAITTLVAVVLGLVVWMVR